MDAGTRPYKRTSDHQLSSYCGDVQIGYDSDYTTNTNNIGGTIVYVADTKFNVNAIVNSNEEFKGTPSELTVNAAASKSILRKQSKLTIPRSSEMSLGTPAKMLANKQM